MDLHAFDATHQFDDSLTNAFLYQGTCLFKDNVATNMTSMCHISSMAMVEVTGNQNVVRNTDVDPGSAELDGFRADGDTVVISNNVWDEVNTTQRSTYFTNFMIRSRPTFGEGSRITIKDNILKWQHNDPTTSTGSGRQCIDVFATSSNTPAYVEVSGNQIEQDVNNSGAECIAIENQTTDEARETTTIVSNNVVNLRTLTTTGVGPDNIIMGIWVVGNNIGDPSSFGTLRAPTTTITGNTVNIHLVTHDSGLDIVGIRSANMHNTVIANNNVTIMDTEPSVSLDRCWGIGSRWGHGGVISGNRISLYATEHCSGAGLGSYGYGAGIELYPSTNDIVEVSITGNTVEVKDAARAAIRISLSGSSSQSVSGVDISGNSCYWTCTSGMDIDFAGGIIVHDQRSSTTRSVNVLAITGNTVRCDPDGINTSFRSVGLGVFRGSFGGATLIFIHVSISNNVVHYTPDGGFADDGASGGIFLELCERGNVVGNQVHKNTEGVGYLLYDVDDLTFAMNTLPTGTATLERCSALIVNCPECNAWGNGTNDTNQNVRSQGGTSFRTSTVSTVSNSSWNFRNHSSLF